MVPWWMALLLSMMSGITGFFLCSAFTIGKWSDYEYTSSDPITKIAITVQGKRPQRRKKWRDSWKHMSY